MASWAQIGTGESPSPDLTANVVRAAYREEQRSHRLSTPAESTTWNSQPASGKPRKPTWGSWVELEGCLHSQHPDKGGKMAGG